MSSVDGSYIDRDRDRQQELDREAQAKRKPPTSQSGKDFNAYVQSKQRQNRPPEENEFSAVVEEEEGYEASQQSYYTPVSFNKKQYQTAKAVSYTSDDNSDLEKKIQEKLDDAAELTRTSNKRNAIKQDLKQQDETITSKNSEKELEQENITVDLSPEEIKNLQSALQKDPSKQTPETKELLNVLDEALQQAEQMSPQAQSKKTETPLASPLQIAHPSREMTKNKAQNKTQSPSSSMEPLAQPDKVVSEKQPSMQPEKVVTPNEENISAKNEPSPEQLAPEMSAQKLEKPVVQKPQESLDTHKETTDSKKENLIPEQQKTKQTQTSENVPQQEMSTASPTTQETPIPVIPNQNQAIPSNVNTKNVNTENIKEMASPKINPEVAPQPTITNLSEPVQIQPLAEKSIENSLTSRFASKKKVEALPAQPDAMPTKTQGQESSGATRQAEFSAMQTKLPETAQPQEIKSSRKAKESDTTVPVEAQAGLAATVNPMLPGIESNVQLQPESQRFSKEDMAELVQKLVDEIVVMKTNGQTDTLVTLKSPEILKDATIKISTYDQATGEINITFGNLSPDAKKLLDNALAREPLADNLKDRANIIVHNIITTTQAETPYILPERKVKEDQERENQQDQGQNENDEK